MLRTLCLASACLAATASVTETARAEEPSRFGIRRQAIWGSDPIADRTFQVHDLVTILVRESAKAGTDTETALEKSSEVSLDISNWFTVEHDGLKIKKANPLDAAGLPKIDVKSSRKHEGEGEIRHEGSFEAQLAAEVIEVLPNGNLVLEACKEVRITDEVSTLVFTGIIRPQDVRPDNTILSDKVARAQIQYTPKGPIADMNRRGFLTRLWDRLNIF